MESLGLPSLPQKLWKPASRLCDLEDPLFNQGPWSLWDRAGDEEELKMVGLRLSGNWGHPCPEPYMPQSYSLCGFLWPREAPRNFSSLLRICWMVGRRTDRCWARQGCADDQQASPVTSPPLPSASGASCRAAGHLGRATRRGINHYRRRPRPGAAGGGCCPRFRPGHKS